MNSMRLITIFFGLVFITAGWADSHDIEIRIAKSELEEDMAELNQDVIKLDLEKGELLKLNKEMEEMGEELQKLVKTLKSMSNKEVANKAFIGILLEDEGEQKEGVNVIGITPDGPAQHAGIRANDVILTVNGESLAGDSKKWPPQKLGEVLRKIKPGTAVEIEVDRGGEQKLFSLVTARRGDHLHTGISYLADDLQKRLEKHESSKAHQHLSGIELYPLNKTLGQYFSCESGMLVLHAPEHSEVPLRSGDVILKIGDRSPKSPSQIWRILDSYDDGETINLTLMRRHKEVGVALTKP